MIDAVSAFAQPARSGAHGFLSHLPRSLLTLCKFCRIRVSSRIFKILALRSGDHAVEAIVSFDDGHRCFFLQCKNLAGRKHQGSLRLNLWLSSPVMAWRKGGRLQKKSTGGSAHLYAWRLADRANAPLR